MVSVHAYGTLLVIIYILEFESLFFVSVNFTFGLLDFVSNSSTLLVNYDCVSPYVDQLSLYLTLNRRKGPPKDYSINCSTDNITIHELDCEMGTTISASLILTTQTDSEADCLLSTVNVTLLSSYCPGKMIIEV